MKTRVIRDLTTIAGIAVILGALVFLNGQLGRLGMVDRYDKMRKAMENKGVAAGIDLLQWDLLRKTKGSLRSGATFDEALAEKDGTTVNLIGYITPIEEFRNMKEFMLLPLPIQCYFCSAPPPRDIMLIQMAEGATADAVEEPIMLSGTLVLDKSEGARFFYAVKNAVWSVGQNPDTLTRKEIPVEHKLHQDPADKSEEELLAPTEPPSAKPMVDPRAKMLPPAEPPQPAPNLVDIPVIDGAVTPPPADPAPPAAPAAADPAAGS